MVPFLSKSIILNMLSTIYVRCCSSVIFYKITIKMLTFFFSPSCNSCLPNIPSWFKSKSLNASIIFYLYSSSMRFSFKSWFLDFGIVVVYRFQFLLPSKGDYKPRYDLVTVLSKASAGIKWQCKNLFSFAHLRLNIKLYIKAHEKVIFINISN